jgi:TfoX/Sxy family transcriptional regulator of competence genes
MFFRETAMAYDPELEARIDLAALHWPGLGKKKMFGGVGYLLNGNMAFGILKRSLVVRCGPEAQGRYLALPGVSVFDVTGRPMAGWLLVAADAIEADADLQRWLEAGMSFAASLEPK